MRQLSLLFWGRYEEPDVWDVFSEYVRWNGWRWSTVHNTPKLKEEGRRVPYSVPSVYVITEPWRSRIQTIRLCADVKKESSTPKWSWL